MRRNVLEEYPDISPNDMDELIGQMRRAFPEAEVTGYQSLIPAMPCSEKDRHVLAAAVIAKAGVLVTNNLKDFPKDECAALGIEVQSADDFLSHALSLDASAVRQALARQAAGKKNPPMTIGDSCRGWSGRPPVSWLKLAPRGVWRFPLRRNESFVSDSGPFQLPTLRRVPQ
jgi:hypothetical protein